MEDDYATIKKVLENKEKENEALRKHLTDMKTKFHNDQDDDQMNPIQTQNSIYESSFHRAPTEANINMEGDTPPNKNKRDFTELPMSRDSIKRKKSHLKNESDAVVNYETNSKFNYQSKTGESKKGGHPLEHRESFDLMQEQFNDNNSLLGKSMINKSTIKLSDEEMNEYYKKFSHLYGEQTIDNVNRSSNNLVKQGNSPKMVNNNVSINMNYSLREDLDLKAEKSRTSAFIKSNSNNFNIQRKSSNREVEKSYFEEGESRILKKIEENNNNGYIPVVKNIKTNIEGIKSQLNSYEQVYDVINSRIEKDGKEKINQLNAQILDLQAKLKDERKLKDKIKELYDKDVVFKQEAFNKEKAYLIDCFSEEKRKLNFDFDSRLKAIADLHSKEKTDLLNKINELDKEITILRQSNKRKDIVEYQKKYLAEMKDLQTTFEDFKKKAYNEFQLLKSQREQERQRADQLAEILSHTQKEQEMNESSIKETEILFKSKTENIRQLIKANEILKIDLDNARKEIDYLKHQIGIMNESEKRLQAIVLENDYINEKMENMGFGVELTKSHSKTTLMDDNKSFVNKITTYSPLTKPRELFKESDNMNLSYVASGNKERRMESSKSVINKKDKNIFENTCLIPEGKNVLITSNKSNRNINTTNLSNNQINSRKEYIISNNSNTSGIKYIGSRKDQHPNNQQYVESSVYNYHGRDEDPHQVLDSAKQISSFEPDIDIIDYLNKNSDQNCELNFSTSKNQEPENNEYHLKNTYSKSSLNWKTNINNTPNKFHEQSFNVNAQAHGSNLNNSIIYTKNNRGSLQVSTSPIRSQNTTVLDKNSSTGPTDMKMKNQRRNSKQIQVTKQSEKYRENIAEMPLQRKGTNNNYK